MSTCSSFCSGAPITSNRKSIPSFPRGRLTHGTSASESRRRLSPTASTVRVMIGRTRRLPRGPASHAARSSTALSFLVHPKLLADRAKIFRHYSSLVIYSVDIYTSGSAEELCLTGDCPALKGSRLAHTQGVCPFRALHRHRSENEWEIRLTSRLEQFVSHWGHKAVLLRAVLFRTGL